MTYVRAGEYIHTRFRFITIAPMYRIYHLDETTIIIEEVY